LLLVHEAAGKRTPAAQEHNCANMAAFGFEGEIFYTSNLEDDVYLSVLVMQSDRV
jgi:hypothetical protein